MRREMEGAARLGFYVAAESEEENRQASLHMNPLKIKLADHPMDWPWRSFSFYAKLKSGLIRVDPVK